MPDIETMSRTMDDTGPGAAVLGVAELRQAILQLLDRRQLAIMMRVSRDLVESVAQLLYKEVDFALLLIGMNRETVSFI